MPLTNMLKKYQEIISSIVKSLFSSKGRKDVVLPNTIRGYKLVSSLSEKSFPYAVGKYKTKKGDKFVLKVWSGSKKNLYYHNLFHEIDVYKTLSLAQKKLKQKKLGGKLSIPEFIEAIETKEKLILVIRFVEGDSLDSIKDINRKLTIYKNANQYIKKLGRFCGRQEIKLIGIRNWKHFSLLYPFIFAVAVIRNPRIFFDIVLLSTLFYKGYLKMIGEKASTLVHGDLNLKNILVGKNNHYYIFDLEQARFTYPDFEFVTSISSKYNRDIFNYLLTEWYGVAENKRTLIRALLANCLTHNLSSYMPEDSVSHYKKTINFAFKNFSNISFQKLAKNI